jgi:hypothetical protein
MYDEVMGREMVHADPLGLQLYGCPNNILQHAVSFSPA